MARPVRPGLPAAREAVRRHQRLGQAQQLVDVHRHRREPAQPRRHAARQRPVPGLLRGRHPGRRQVPRAAARLDRLRRGQRPSPRGQRGAAGHHLDLPGRPARGRDGAAREGRGHEHQAGRLHGDRRQRAAEAAARRRRPQPHQPVRLHRQQVRVPRRRARPVASPAPTPCSTPSWPRPSTSSPTTSRAPRTAAGGRSAEQGRARGCAPPDPPAQRNKRIVFNGDNYTRSGTPRPSSAACPTSAPRPTRCR